MVRVEHLGDMSDVTRTLEADFAAIRAAKQESDEVTKKTTRAKADPSLHAG